MLNQFFTKFTKNFLPKLYYTANSEITVINSGFALGFVHTIDRENIVTKPLTTIFCGTIFGGFTMIGATFVGSIMPPHIRFIIPLAVCMSCAHHIRNGKRKTPETSSSTFKVEFK